MRVGLAHWMSRCDLQSDWLRQILSLSVFGTQHSLPIVHERKAAQQAFISPILDVEQFLSDHPYMDIFILLCYTLRRISLCRAARCSPLSLPLAPYVEASMR